MSRYEQVGESTARSPFGAHLNWQVVTMEDNRAVFRMPFAEHNVTVGTMVHGGAIAALADAAATAACWASPDVTPESRGATVAMNVNYLSAALDCDVVADARVVQRGGSLCVAAVDVLGPDERLLARATITYKLSHKRPDNR